MELRNAIFFENIYPCKDKAESSKKRTFDESTSSDPVQDQPVSTEEVGEPSNSVEPRRSGRTKVAKTFGPYFITYMLDDEPKTVREALARPDASL